MTGPDATALIVDDDQGTRENNSAVAWICGFRKILTASLGNEAMELIRAQMPDLLIIDYTMRDTRILGFQKTGLDVIREMRTLRGGKNVKCILCTSDADLLNRVSDPARELGVQMLVKPVDIDVLERAVRQIMSLPFGGGNPPTPPGRD